MSRVGKRPIPITKGVQVKIEGQHLSVKAQRESFAMTCLLRSGSNKKTMNSY